MPPLSSETSLLEELGAVHTASEINAQPDLWMEIYGQISTDREKIASFISGSLPGTTRIILTGAGTSAFIGLSLTPLFNSNFKVHTDSVATTDLLSYPENYFNDNESIILVSFARSGNSPESTGVTELADKLCRRCIHLIITCDGNGRLANYQTHSEKLVILLPPSANDKGLAMTGSYSGMLLCGILIARLREIESLGKQISILHDYGKKILSKYSEKIREIASIDFKRAVFLGSGPFFGTATESHLKLQELTDGIIICKNETYLGFRHGPKAVTDENTLVVFIFSNKPYVWQYERDLVLSMKKGRKPLCTIGVFENAADGLEFDLGIRLSDSGNQLDEDFLTVCSVIPAQLLGYYKSLDLGLRPDNPSKSGAISRVVEDVYIYKF